MDRRVDWRNLATGLRTRTAAVVGAALTMAATTAAFAQEAGEEAVLADPAAAEGISQQGLLNLGIVLAIFIAPAFIGNWLGKRLRMPDHGWKFAVAIGTLAAAAVVVSRGEIKLGPDLSGGITLIYQIDQQAAADKEAGGDDQQANAPKRSQQELVDALVTQLAKRVDPTGTKEVSIRSYGEGQIEIIIPKASPEELESIERSIYTAGALEFRIVASRKFSKHRSIIELAEKLPKGANIVRLDDGTSVARWVGYDEAQIGDDASLVRRIGATEPQMLVLTNDGQDVKGDQHLKSASVGADQLGKPAVNFSFNTAGSFAFGELTAANLPDPSGEKYRLGILLDNRLLNAPSINSKITDQGIIEGNMTQKEVEEIVGILQAGSLPAALDKDPISREQISPTIGKQTVEKGRKAIAVSLAAVLVFMVFYYRFAGLVACMALAANVLLILGCMVLIKGAFTLPGLAGLVLTVGMSVDANVLVFERIREELDRGTALRMAIRNGFARAMSTIVDASVTTLITAIVIYKIAPDNVKGFGVTLILGILMSMFTAVFMSRIVFDVAEKTGYLKKLTMARLVGGTRIDFMGLQRLCVTASLLLVALGLFGLFSRGRDILNIDFTGGSSVTMVFEEPMSFAEVKKTIEEKTDLGKQNLTLVEVGDTQTRYTVTSVNEDVAAVEQLLAEAFDGKLKTYHVEREKLQPISAAMPRSGASRLWGVPAGPLALVSLLQDDGDESVATAEEEESAEEASPAAEADDADEATQPAEEEADSAAPTDQPVAATADADDDDAFVNGTQATLKFSLGEDDSSDDGIGYDALDKLVQDALEATKKTGAAYRLSSPEPNYSPTGKRRHVTWDVQLALPEAEAQEVIAELESTINGHPVFPLASKIGGRVAGKLAGDAIAAIVISLAGIIGYIWYRFNGVIYGLAAVVALLHDVIITLGIVALSAYVVDGVPALASLLQLEKFQISLPMVAAILTLIGYSLNDTIVVFDRIREVKGKSPRLTRDMINASVNQTLSRTLLTSGTTLLTVIVLYFIGGDGIHGFAFALLIGIVVGTYSSIHVAAPTLLWMSDKAHGAKLQQPVSGT
ncbi:MAG: protein translocase subunit SecD [Pirellulales bacterium]|nr:protein translocase subunit SecD [Pirellulales bacterium]